MKVTFLGVGEACDPACGNTSILVESEFGAKKHYILLDCGFTTPHRYFSFNLEADALDALWISHFHGDHFFGVPLLLLRFWEMGRIKPLQVIGREGIREKIDLALELAYPGFGEKLRFPLEYLIVEQGESLKAAGLTWGFAENIHSQPCLAVRIDDNEKAVFYSGDGCPTEQSGKLAQGCDLIIHEAYRLAGHTPNHGNVRDVAAFARKAGAKHLAVVHVAHFERLHQAAIAREFEKTADLHAFLPEAGDSISL
ncbi:MAG: ribonuclease Z [Desulfobulbaceae bacterium]|nr:ribonuclease Z [Desulfobulbaceae bacterium]HIJ79317.1 ribonuclease Z [Deltaproteobacteria bacterium]